ncbi:hypothetical protein H920_20490 [Fukomys damarensis]|uniref:Uncharacterized protein n=1 Tax=Fukomys damarensis TaxID=885580 RepID=A0A091CMD8_FUKDA|nr:hypothetical protein H920_20490 [Fukomys damarensis]
MVLTRPRLTEKGDRGGVEAADKPSIQLESDLPEQKGGAWDSNVEPHQPSRSWWGKHEDELARMLSPQERREDPVKQQQHFSPAKPSKPFANIDSFDSHNYC